MSKKRVRDSKPKPAVRTMTIWAWRKLQFGEKFMVFYIVQLFFNMTAWILEKSERQRRLFTLTS